MNSVYLKNCLLLAGMVLVSLLVFLIAFSLILRNQTISQQQTSLEANANAVFDMYSTFRVFNPNQEEYLDTTGLLVSIVTLPANYMVVANSYGVVVACSERGTEACEHIGQRLPGSLRTPLAEGETVSKRAIIPGLVDRNSYVHARALYSPRYGTHSGYVLAVSATDAVTAEWGAIVSLFLLIAAIVLLMAIVIAMVVARHLASPLREMSSAANRFARGDYSARVAATERQDEVGELTTAFNAMADSIERSELMRREFVGSVSHEFKTPMTSITGFAEGILDGTVPPEKEREYLEIVVAETRRLSRLVRRMLEISRLQAMDVNTVKKQDFDVTELLRRGVLGLEGKILQKGLDVDLHLPEDPVLVLGDEDSIMQVTYNLLENAIKFSHPSTSLGITLVRQSGKASITIKNHGDTISEEELPLLFNRFHKSDKSRSHDKDGIGLGLYIVKTIINTHQEDIFVRSKNDVTEFMFTLTLAPKKKGK